jgi:hypothetical protein
MALLPWTRSRTGGLFWLPRPDRVVGWAVPMPLALGAASGELSLGDQLALPECDLAQLVSDRVAQVCPCVPPPFLCVPHHAAAVIPRSAVCARLCVLGRPYPRIACCMLG